MGRTSRANSANCKDKGEEGIMVGIIDKVTDFGEEFDIAGTASFILRRGFVRVALQFPDELLQHSVAVSSALNAEIACQSEFCPHLESRGAVRLFIMADTTFGSCCADEIAAIHIDAECVVHYGHSCFSRTSRLPVWLVFGKAAINTDYCTRRVIDFASKTNKPILVLCGPGYFHAWETMREKVLGLKGNDLDVTYANCPPQLMEAPAPMESVESEVHGREGGASSGLLQQDQILEPGYSTCSREGISNGQSIKSDANIRSSRMNWLSVENGESKSATSLQPTGLKYSVCGLEWFIPNGRQLEDYVILWVGRDDPGLTTLSLIFNSSTIVRYDPTEDKIMTDVANQSRLLQRRYFLVERAKDASVVGIVVGTLGVSGYRNAIQTIRKMVEAAGKKPYTLVMGKPNPAKLANFPECEVFVLVSCPQTAILDSKEYLAPVITPFEAGLAFLEGQLWTGAYQLDFAAGSRSNPVVKQFRGSSSLEPRFSFLKGGYVGEDHSEDPEVQQTALSKSVALSQTSEHALRLHSVSSRSIINTDRSALDIRSGAEYLASRTYQGLNINIEGPEGPQKASTAVTGRTGRASGYKDEPNQ